MRLPLTASGAADEEFAAWVADGYASAFRTAYLILRDRQDAEEAVQDAFLRAWRFRSAIPPGEGVKPWLYRVVVNACLSKLRSERTRRSRAEAVDPAAMDRRAARAGGGAGGDPERAAEAHEAREAVLAAIAGLPAHLRVVVVLRYYAQLSEKEIASAIRRRPGTVKSRLHQARICLGDDPRLAAHGPARVGAAEGSPDD